MVDKQEAICNRSRLEWIISVYSELATDIYSNVAYIKRPETSLFVPFLLNPDLYIALLLFNYLFRDEKLFLLMATHA